ncbi:hypothetical protein MKFW12EY_25270 [Methylomonas koyamae]|nr:hypothetical protein MKFW12EY_25270 [Methylomonas koyamae]
MIAFEKIENEEHLAIYVNNVSRHGIKYLDFFDSESWVLHKHIKKNGKLPPIPDNIFPTKLKNFPSLNPRTDEILKIQLSTLEDFRILLLWYAGYSYTQDEIQNILLRNNYNFPDSPFEIHSATPINKKLLKRGGLLKYFKTLFETNDKPDLHRKYIKRIIGENQEAIFYETEASDYFKVLSLFKFLSKANDKWHSLICNNMEFPSLSNNPVALEYEGFIDQESIHTHETKRMKDAILRCFYNRLIQPTLIKQPSLKPILFSDNECFTKFDIQLAEFDIYIQKLFDLCMIRKSSYRNGDISTAIDEAFLDARRYVDALSQKFDSEAKFLTKDDLILTLIKCASINRAENDYDGILNIYNKIEHDGTPDKIDIMKSVQSTRQIHFALSDIFDIKTNEIPDDLIQCAAIVNEMFSRFYNREASPEERYIFKDKIYSPAYVGLSATLLLNGYIKSNKFRSRTENIDDFKIRIRGETNNGVNVYSCLSEIYNSCDLDKKSLSSLIYCMPDDLYKFLTARYSIVIAGMESQRPIKETTVDALKLKRRKIEIQKEIIEKFKDYNIEHTYNFVGFFKTHVINLEGFLKDPVNIINLWLSQ